MSSMPENPPQDKKLIPVYIHEDWLNANPEGWSRSIIRATTNEIDKQEVSRYNYLLYLYLVFTAVMLNHIFFPQLHCNEFVSSLSGFIQFFVFSMIAKEMNVFKRVRIDFLSFLGKYFS